jgi:hypothetical protein
VIRIPVPFLANGKNGAWRSYGRNAVSMVAIPLAGSLSGSFSGFILRGLGGFAGRDFVSLGGGILGDLPNGGINIHSVRQGNI